MPNIWITLHCGTTGIMLPRLAGESQVPDCGDAAAYLFASRNVNVGDVAVANIDAGLIGW